MSKSANDYIEANDFENCYLRWQEATHRWMRHWFNACVEIFEADTAWSTKYSIDYDNEQITLVIIKPTCKRRERSDIEWLCDRLDYPAHTEQFYLVRFVDKDDNTIYSKVGTTTRTVQKRMSEELLSYRKTRPDIEKVYVQRVYDCGEYPAEYIESVFRAHYIKQYPQSFKKNDRFIGVDFDLAKAEQIIAECLAKEI